MKKKLKTILAVVLMLVLCITTSFTTIDTYASTTKVPAKVSGLTKSYQSHYNYKLTWKKASYATKYQVYRATSKSGTYKLVKTTTSRAYTAYVTPGQKYYYKVRAVNGTKKGTFSDKLLVKTADVKKLGTGIPKYWNEEIEKSIKSFNAAEGQSSFMYFTDAHWSANTKHSPAIINYLYKTLDMDLVVFGGDAIAGTFEKTSKAIAELESFYGAFDEDINLMSTTGNHDYNTSSGDIAPLTEKKVYELIYKKEKSFATVAQYGRCAYKDDEENKVRYISLYFDGYLNNTQPQMGSDYDNSYPTESEIKWLEQTVQDEALDEDWTIMLFTHGYWNFVKKGKTPTATPSGAEFAEYLLNLQSDENTKADIGCWIVGHTHRDLNKLLKNEDGQIRLICTNCDTYLDGSASRGTGYWGGQTMEKGHDTEQVIDLIRLDTVNKKIRMIRVGAGKNRTYSY